MKEQMNRLLLIDGNSIMNRAFYGTQAGNLQNAEGLYTGAVFGFVNIFLKVSQEVKPTHIAVTFDVHAKTFRHKMYDGYKATRKGMPEELRMQMPVIREVLDAMNIHYLEIEGFEADDIIGTYSRIAEEQDMECVILTGDKDSLQLVSQKTCVLLPVTKMGNTTTSKMDIDGVKERFSGLGPCQVVDLKALMGDSSDNIPGVPGVGEKTAEELLQKYGTLDAVYEHIDEITKPALNKKLREGKELAYLSRTLATINREVPIELELGSDEKRLEALVAKESDALKLLNIFTKLEFRQLISKMKLKELADTAKELNDDDSLMIPGLDELSPVKAFPKIEKTEVFLGSELSEAFDKLHIKDLKELYINTISDKQGEITSVEISDGEKISVNVNFGMIDIFDTFENLTKEILQDKNVKKYFLTAKPFVLMMKNAGINVNGIEGDMIVAAYLADSTRKNETIEDVCRYFTGVECGDISCFKSVIEESQKKLDSLGMTELYKNVELPLISVLAEFEYQGFYVKREILERESIDFTERLEELTKKIYEECGTEFNINSPKQLGEVLFDKLKIPGGQKTKTGYKTGQEVLEALADDYPVIAHIIEYRQNAKLKSTYIDGLLDVIDKTTGKVHSSFNQTVTATGRISSSEPNLQNIPVRSDLGRLVRRAFFASKPDRILVDADYSQIELRLLADMSGDTNMINAFNAGKDIHAATAAKVNNVPIEEVTHKMRSDAKAVNFGIVYGISDFGLGRDLGISVYEAKRYIQSYFKEYPMIKTFLDDLVASAKASGYALTPFGRRRNLPELSSPKYMIRQFGERVAMNMPIQGAAADIMKMAMVKVYEELQKSGLDAHLILQVHDELLIDAKACDREKVEALLKESMENVVKLKVQLPVSISSDYCWDNCK